MTDDDATYARICCSVYGSFLKSASDDQMGWRLKDRNCDCFLTLCTNVGSNHGGELNHLKAREIVVL